MRCPSKLFWSVVCTLAFSAVAASPAPGQAEPARRIAPGPLVVEVLSAVDDKPVGGAVVRLAGRFAVSDPEGKLTLDGVPAGKYQVTIEQPGFDRLTHDLELPAGQREQTTLILSPTKPWAVEGRVIEARTRSPLAGAHLTIVPVDVIAAQKGRYDLATDWQGKFSILEMPAGKYRVALTAAGCADKTVEVELTASPSPLELVLERVEQEASLTVSVVDSVTGAPLGGARVSLAECWPTGRFAEATANGSGVASFPHLALSRINRADPREALTATRRLVTVRATARGHAESVAPVDLARGAVVQVRLDPLETLAEREPNDAIGAAQEVHPGAAVKLAIAKVGDRDFFRFRTSMPGHLRLTLGSGAGLETLLRLYDREAKLLKERGVGADSENVLEVDVAAGEFVAAVEEWGCNGASPRSMLLTVGFTPVLDPGETFDPEGRLLRAGEETRATLYPWGDVDRHRFEMARPGQVRLTLSANNLERLVRLLDAEARVVGEVGVGPGSAAELIRQVPAGRYLAEVHEWGENGFSSEPCTLRLEAIEDDGVDDPPLSGSRLASARTLELGGLAGATVWPTGDVDRWAVAVPTQGILHARALGPIETLLRLRNSNGDVIAEVGAGPGSPGHTAVHLDGPQILHLEIHEWGENGCSPFPCLVSTRFEPCDELETEERNDTADTATPAEPGEPIHGSILPVHDVDCYRFAVDHPAWLTVSGSGPVELLVRVRDEKLRQLAEQGVGAGAPVDLRLQVLPGEHFLEVHEWGENGWSAQPYSMKLSLQRAESRERVPLRNDPPRTLRLGEAQPFSIDHFGDRDRFVLNVARAGKFTVRMNAPVEYLVRVFDDRTGRQLHEQGVGAGSFAELGLEANGPTRYRLEVSEWGENGWSLTPGYVLADTAGRRIAAETLAAAVDPIDPTLVTFWRKELAPYEKAAAAGVDADGDGRLDLELPAGVSRTFRYPAEGLYVATAHLRGAEGARGLARTWIEAVGPAERKGVRVLAHFPAAGQVVDHDEPARAAAISYAGARITHLTLTLDGKPAGIGYTPPFQFPVRWDSLGGGEHELVFTAVDAQGNEGRLTRTVRVSDYFNLQPQDGAVISGNSVKLGWVGPRFGPSRVHYRPAGEVAWREAVGESGVRRQVDLTDLEPGKAYQFQPIGTGPLPVSTGARAQATEAMTQTTAALEATTGPMALTTGTLVEELPDVEGSSAQAATTPTSLGAGELDPRGGPLRTVTRVKGLAFGQPRYGANIRRDYDQRLGVSVRNHGEKPLTVKLVCGKPPPESRLLVGFVGEGSEGAPFVLAPGDERQFMLGLSAQDVTTSSHRFPIRLASDEGFSDEAEVAVEVKLPEVKLAWETVNKEGSDVRRVLRLSNQGDTLTDLDVLSESPDVVLSPSVRHALFPAGTDMTIVALARLHEGFSTATARLTARAVGKAVSTDVTVNLPKGQKLFGVALRPGQPEFPPPLPSPGGGGGQPETQARAVGPASLPVLARALRYAAQGAAAQGERNPGQPSPATTRSADADLLAARAMAGSRLDPAAVDWSLRSSPEDSDGDARADRWTVDDPAAGVSWVGDDTDGDGEVDFVHGDLGPDGQFDTSAFKTERGWEETNLVEAWLEMGFALPWARSSYERHDVDVILNDQVVGRLRDAIPEGNYRFRLPAGLLKFNEAGVPEGNVVAIQSKHLRGGHYVVSSDFSIKLRLTGTRSWIAAGDRDEAEKAARKADGLSMEGPDYSLSSAELSAQPAQPTAGADVKLLAELRNLGATPTPSVVVALRGAKPGEPAVELARELVRDVPLTGSVPVALPWKAAPGTHQLKVVVDPDNESGDPNPENNEAILTVTVAGEAAATTVTFLEPTDGGVLRDSVFTAKVQATDSGGVARVEGSVDGGLFRPLQAEGGVWVGRGRLQPGPHKLTVRATGSGGQQVEQSVGVKVETTRPAVAITAPTTGTTLAARQAEIILEAQADSVLTAVRVNGGPWTRAVMASSTRSSGPRHGTATPVAAGSSPSAHPGPAGGWAEATATLPLAFGRNVIDAVCFSTHGTQGTSAIVVTCSVQPEDAETGPAALSSVGSGHVEVAGLGEVDLFGPVNGFVDSHDAMASQAASVEAAAARPRPAALAAGSAAVYRCVTEDVYLTARYSTDGVSVTVSPGPTTPAAPRLAFEGPLAPGHAGAGSFEGSAPVQGGVAGLSVTYHFDDTGRLAVTRWSSEDDAAPAGSYWYRVRAAGDSAPKYSDP